MAHWTQVSDRCPLGYLYSVLGIATTTYKVQRGITQIYIYIQELWFLRSAYRRMLVNSSMTFHEDIKLQSGRHCILFLA